jgi:hypothetical protein
MSKFDELIGELETLAKAQPADDGDEKIVAAAAEGGGQGSGEPDGDETGAVAGDGDGDEADDGKPMAKSFKVTLADGTEMEAQDGTELVKALQDRIEATEGTLAKALGQAVALIKSQGERLTAMDAKLKAIGGEGKGRKAVLTVVEKPAASSTLAKSEPEGMKPEEFMAKALDAQKLGRITGLQVATAEACLNRGQQVPADIIANVLKA